MGSFSCYCGKRRFRDEIGAKFALSQAKRKDSEKRAERRAYPCPTSNCWHLTSVAIEDVPAWQLEQGRDQ